MPDAPQEVVAHGEGYAELSSSPEDGRVPDGGHEHGGVATGEGVGGDATHAEPEADAGDADGDGGEGNDREGVNHNMGGDRQALLLHSLGVVPAGGCIGWIG